MDEAPEPLDDDLVARTQSGDPEAFDELVIRYSPQAVWTYLQHDLQP